MAFENLTERLQSVLKKLKGQARLSQANMEDMLREVRLALLDADVHLEVVKQFLADLRQRMVGSDVLSALSPGQMVVKIVADELTNLLGKDTYDLQLTKRPSVILIVGLQGGGKTTNAAKLAYYLQTKQQKKPLLVAADVQRPAAIDQLEQLGAKHQLAVYAEREQPDVVGIVERALRHATTIQADVVIVDTAGRLHVDDELMQELVSLQQKTRPQEILLVVDAMSGQDTVTVAQAFLKTIPVTGVIMTKLDGDARGGAALSIRHHPGLPILFSGIGEKIKDWERFQPRQMAERILGMGDILKLIETAQENIDEKRATRLMTRMLSGQFDLSDMLEQLETAAKMGPLGGLMKMMPGMPKVSAKDQAQAEVRIKKTKAVILSMTPEERHHPEVLRASRKERIAKGSGLTSTDVNNVLRQYEQSKQVMKQMSAMMGKRR
jgi:signal recognition particle subunit SRP54